MIKKRILGFALATMMAVFLSGCGQNRGGQVEPPTNTVSTEVSKQELPKPQKVMSNCKQFANLALVSTKTTGGQSMGIDVIPNDYDDIAFGGNFVFPEGDHTIGKGGPFITLNFTRDAQPTNSAQLSLTVRRHGKIVAEIKLKPGESSSVELSDIKPQGDSIEWSVTEPVGGIIQEDGVSLKMCGSKKGLVCYKVRIP